MNTQTGVPILNAIHKYNSDDVMQFCTPGHKMGHGMHDALRQIIGNEALSLDLGLMHELDDLHEPQGCIAEAQNLAAEAYSASGSKFVINGTTSAIQAMIMATVRDGEKIIIPRNAHRSIIGGIILAGAIPVYMQPIIDYDLGIAMGITRHKVEEAICKHPDAKGILIVNPTYYGVTSDLKEIAETVHRNDMILLVDEAHGPHLTFHEELPISAITAGADVCAQSTHKILGALTQCSMLHYQGTRIDKNRLSAMLKLLQSTSPNYLFLASLDVARMQMATLGRDLLSKTIALSQWLREEINSIPGLYCFGADKCDGLGVHGYDPTKITVTVKKLGITGIQAERILRFEYKVQAELSDVYNLLFFITIGDTEKTVEHLARALYRLAINHKCDNKISDDKIISLPKISEQILSPREALFADSHIVPFRLSEGMICAEVIAFYPPGIPVIGPGEKITAEIISYCNDLIDMGLRVSGPDDAELKTVRVVTQKKRWVF